MTALVAEARKVPAFLRRDWLTMLSYRAAFVGDLLAIVVQALMFGFIAELVDPATLPTYNGVETGYFEFVMVGVVIATVSGLLLQKVSMAIRQEQMMGTLEALLVTPASPTTVQIGSAAFDLLFVPVRMAALLLAVALTLGLGFEPSGILPTLVLLISFVPFVWGLGLVAAGVIVTFRRGGGDRHIIGLGPRTAAALPALDVALGTLGRVQSASDAGHALIALSPGVSLGAALSALTAAGVEVTSCRDERPPIERAFLTVTGGQAA